MAFEELNKIRAQQEAQQLAKARHNELLDSSTFVSNTVLDAIMKLIEYMEGHVSQVQVINPLTKIGTPDAFKVVETLNQLHATVKKHENVDLSEITEVMKEVLGEIKQVPKEHAEIPEAQEIDYTEQFKQLQKLLETVDKTIKSQNLTVEAPIVNVEKPDLEPVRAAVSDVVRAVNQIDIPKPESPYTKRGKSVKVELDGNSIPTVQTNLLINEKIDEWVPVYGDEFGDESSNPSQIKYYWKKKKVATLSFTYDDRGRITRCKKS